MTSLRYGPSKIVVRLPARTADSFLYPNAKISYIEKCKSDYNTTIVKINYIYCALLDDIQTFFSDTYLTKMAILGSSCGVLAQITPFTKECTSNLGTCDVKHGRGFGEKLMGMKGL